MGGELLSIVMVIGSHCVYSTGFPKEWTGVFVLIFDGGLGIRFFFLISGFIITWLASYCLTGHHSGRYSTTEKREEPANQTTNQTKFHEPIFKD
jgi:peptidoglycan/LPS O-acetylase OafA/YrhL